MLAALWLLLAGEGIALAPPASPPQPPPAAEMAATRTGNYEPAAEAGAPEEASARCPAGESLTLDQLLDLAVRSHPDVAIARERVEAARGRMIQAGLYPNPTVTYEGDDIGAPIHSSGTEGVIFGQQIITAHKLKIARAAAAHGVAAADWVAITRWYDVVTRVRIAYFELLTAQRNLQTSEELVRVAQQALDAARKLQKAGAATGPDVLRAQVELRQNQVSLVLAQQRLDAARKLLAVAVGDPSLPTAPVAGNLEAPVPSYEWEPLHQAVLSRSSEVQEAQANVLQAEQLLKLAQATVCPDIQVQVKPFYNAPDHATETKVQVGVGLPIFNRNQGNIGSARADLARLHEEVRLVELRLTERLTLAYQRYLAARQQAEIYEKQLLPEARESLRLILQGYEKGEARFDYTAVLQAQRILVQVQLAYVQALGEMWRGVSEIAGLLQIDTFTSGCEGLPPPRQP